MGFSADKLRHIMYQCVYMAYWGEAAVSGMYQTAVVQKSWSNDGGMQKVRQDIDIQDIYDRMELFQLIFDNIPSGAMVTDTNGIVIHLNMPYARFLGIDIQKGLGRHCNEAVENSRMHVAAKTQVSRRSTRSR